MCISYSNLTQISPESDKNNICLMHVKHVLSEKIPHKEPWNINCFNISFGFKTKNPNINA
jgi:hypothetical protein